MVDAPGGWELQRALEQIRQDNRDGFASVNARLDKLVTTDAFSAEQRRVDDRLKDLADDITSERTARQGGDGEQQKSIDRLTANLRWVAAAIILPIALFIATLLINSRGAA